MIHQSKLFVIPKNRNWIKRIRFFIGIASQFRDIFVTDTGEGMPPEVLSRVMEPFFTTKEEGKGSGLGLSMVYGFMKQSGGAIRIRSLPGQGTTVSLVFPVAEQEVVAGPAPRQARREDRAHGNASFFWE